MTVQPDIPLFLQPSSQCMVEPGAVKPLGNFTAQESLVDSLLQQFTQVGDSRAHQASEKCNLYQCSGGGEDPGGKMELCLLLCAWRHVRALVGSRIRRSQQGGLLQTDNKVVHTALLLPRLHCLLAGKLYSLWGGRARWWQSR